MFFQYFEILFNETLINVEKEFFFLTALFFQYFLFRIMSKEKSHYSIFINDINVISLFNIIVLMNYF